MASSQIVGLSEEVGAMLLPLVRYQMANEMAKIQQENLAALDKYFAECRKAYAADLSAARTRIEDRIVAEALTPIIDEHTHIKVYLKDIGK